MTRLIVGPFNRVEGDLEVQLEVAKGHVASARVNAPLFRGFERMLDGRDPLDALVIVPRICGICSVSQSVAAARTLAGLSGVQAPPNGALATNLMLACENMADHLTHFYLYFMPDFTRPEYCARPWYDEARKRFAVNGGEHRRTAIAARQRWFTLMGTLGGKWPHTHSVHPGGSARGIDAAERLRLLARVREFRAFLEGTLYGAPLEAVAAIDSIAALDDWCNALPGAGDLRLFMHIAADLRLHTLGAGPGHYLSYGAYAQPDAALLFASGSWNAQNRQHCELDPLSIIEDSTHAWLEDGDSAQRHPFDGLTQPAPDKPGAYTWNKAPRLHGKVIETGALARQVVDGQPLLRDASAQFGGCVLTRVLARLIEFARVVPAMEQWLHGLRPGDPFFTKSTLPQDGRGFGLVEAARGALGHWVVVSRGRIAGYQIIAPTSWNFSPRDADGKPGALEAALVGTPVPVGDPSPVAVQHIVRSFDPCMVCTVH